MRVWKKSGISVSPFQWQLQFVDELTTAAEGNGRRSSSSVEIRHPAAILHEDDRLDFSSRVDRQGRPADGAAGFARHQSRPSRSRVSTSGRTTSTGGSGM